jgi:hypothetical protein
MAVSTPPSVPLQHLLAGSSIHPKRTPYIIYFLSYPLYPFDRAGGDCPSTNGDSTPLNYSVEGNTILLLLYDAAEVVLVLFSCTDQPMRHGIRQRARAVMCQWSG